MGGMAASGGYYISCAANYIVAEPTTLTGSIGIFGLIPDASQLLSDKLGLHFDVVKTNAHADFGTPARPFNPSEAQMMQGYIQRGYKLFTERVADGRNMKTGQVEKLAEGRVWTGTAGRGKRIGRCQRQPPDRHQKGCFIGPNKRLPYGIRTDSVPLVRGFV